MIKVVTLWCNLRNAPAKIPLGAQHRVRPDKLDELQGLRGMKDPLLDDLPVRFNDEDTELARRNHLGYHH